MAGKAGEDFEIKPMDQFIVKPLFSESTLYWYTPSNIALWMLLAVAVGGVLFGYGTRNNQIVPNRLQLVAEMTYRFVYNMVESTAGKDAIKYFPIIFTLFIFIIFANFLGLIPLSFTSTAHIAVSGTMAFAIFTAVTLLGIVKNGRKFLGLFWIKSAPLGMRPLLAIIELISYLVRPLSHSIRLAGNLMAGHTAFKVLAGLAGGMGVFFFVPVLAITAFYALEVLVAFIQAYVFTILTCVYLHDALHPEH